MCCSSITHSPKKPLLAEDCAVVKNLAISFLFSFWRAIFHSNSRDFLETSKETNPGGFTVTITERSGKKIKVNVHLDKKVKIDLPGKKFPPDNEEQEMDNEEEET